jgi:hypothetical protein
VSEVNRSRLIKDLRQQRPELSLQEAKEIIYTQYPEPRREDSDMNPPSELALTLARMAEEQTKPFYARYLWRAAADIAGVDEAFKTSTEYEQRARATFEKWQR